MATTTMNQAPPRFSVWRIRVQELRDDMLAMANELGALQKAALEASEVETVVAGGAELDGVRRELRVAGRSVPVTPGEFKFLARLLGEPGRVWGRQTLLREMCGIENPDQTRLVDAHANRLRTKLGAAAGHIQSVRGFGYRWNTEVSQCQ